MIATMSESEATLWMAVSALLIVVLLVQWWWVRDR